MRVLGRDDALRAKCVRSSRADAEDTHHISSECVQRREQKTPFKTGETETETFASRRRDQKKMRPMSRRRESAVL